MQIKMLKDISEILGNLATIAALIVGGIWTYRLFIKRRLGYAKAEVTHAIVHRTLSPDKILIHLTVKIRNIGDVLLSIVNADVRLQQVIPAPDFVLDAAASGEDPIQDGQTEIEWPILRHRISNWDKGKIEIEPGESDVFDYDFIIDVGVSTVEVYSYIKNKMKTGREIGWGKTTLYDITLPETNIGGDSNV